MFDRYARTKVRRAALVACGFSAMVGAAAAPTGADAVDAPLHVERVTTIAPFPRGLAMVDGDLYVLCRGRVRGAGGVTAAIDDQAGTIYIVDPEVTQPIDEPEISPAIRANGTLFTGPTDPPFKLWDRTATPPESDRRTDRPYCTLRYHDATKSFYLCAFSGIDKHRTPDDPVAFSKNFTDAILRYDTRTGRWHEVERHDARAGGRYPARDPRFPAPPTPDPAAPPHRPPYGWLDGPDNCLVVGDSLYAVSKDNSLLVRYDLSALIDDPDAGPPPSEVVLDEDVDIEGRGRMTLKGQSALACRDRWLYIAYRTTSQIIRIRLDDRGLPVKPIRGQLLAQFDPFDPETFHSANITDMDFDDAGRLYVVSAQPSRIYRFTPGTAPAPAPGTGIASGNDNIYDARDGRAKPWADLAAITGNPKMKSENVLYADGWLYVTSGDGYSYQRGADGTVYRIRIDK